ncbi:Cyclin-dependent kinase 11B, partial [Eschrichtius robustus]|nr:Cyclin-dependent kinase 11B [Eschrichtius robustus]
MSDDRDSKRDSLEEGELRDHRMEITIRNSPYRREDSMEDRGEEDDSLAIKPPQQMSRKEKAHHRKDEKRKEKRRHRSHSTEGGKHARVKEKEREHERRKRHREEQDKARREWERQKRRELAREHSRRERDLRVNRLMGFHSLASGAADPTCFGHWSLIFPDPRTTAVPRSRRAPGPESRFDRDSGESEEGEEEVGEGTPQSSALTEGDFVPDSPALSPIELKQELPKYLPALQGCRSVEEFQCLNRIEEGTYGVVYRAKDKKTDEIVALKRLKMEKEKEGFPITSLREINTILKAQHPNIVTVREIVVGSNMDKIYIVMNYVEHDLKSLMETMKQPFLPGEVKTLMIQLLRGVKHLHDNWILHRDLKTSNLLLSHAGILKVGDFGLAREYGSPLKAYTPVVVTLWYRAPELLLGAKEYSTAVDMWSVGCIFGELLTQKPLFPGKSEIDQINKVFKDLGTPSEKIWPGYNDLPAVKKMTFTEYPYNNLRKRFGALLSDQGFDLMN